MKRWGRSALLGLLLGLGACQGAEEGPACEGACSGCQGAQCPTGVCGVAVLLDESCEGQVPQAEVALGQCLEELALVSGQQTLLCGHLEGYSDALVTARGGDLVWQRRVWCRPDRQGQVQLLTLGCDEADVVMED